MSPPDSRAEYHCQYSTSGLPVYYVPTWGGGVFATPPDLFRWVLPVFAVAS